VIHRALAPHLSALAARWPVLTVTGPRQAGKTTLCQALFPHLSYLSLESPDTQELARLDPRGLLAEHPNGLLLDEVQRVPSLLSYLQGEVDRDPRPGRFVLTGSANFALLESVTQSLAGRTAIVNLLPCSWSELQQFTAAPKTLAEALWSGGYPALFDRGVPANEWLRNYAATYVERDVRQLLNVGDLSTFQTFLRLCAGRSGQLLNLTQLGSDAGISQPTAKSWLSLLETAFVAFRLQPYHANLTSREVKTPKLYFYDSGLVCALLGVRSPQELLHHPLRGPIFETWVLSEIVKARTVRGLLPSVYFVRDHKGFEIDFLVDLGAVRIAVEAKSAQTLTSSFFGPLRALEKVLGIEAASVPVAKRLVYGGVESQRRLGVEVAPWHQAGALDWDPAAP
jgi:uncharacterized protein